MFASIDLPYPVRMYIIQIYEVQKLVLWFASGEEHLVASQSHSLVLIKGATEVGLEFENWNVAKLQTVH